MEKAKEFKPTKAFNKVFDERGGIRGCTSVGDMPRNRKQVRNARYKLSDPQPKKDTLYEVMKMCIDDQSRADPFVRCVQAAPEATCVLATNNQLHDLERFCTGSGVFSILGVDPTFNLRDFALTVTTYRHLMLEHRRTGNPPVMVGPLFAHQKKEIETYYTFASSLLKLRPSLMNLQCIGTDGEKAIAKGFQMTSPNCKYILCFLHQRRNIQFKLSEIGISSKYASLFVRDLFGFQEGKHCVWTSGLDIRIRI